MRAHRAPRIRVAALLGLTSLFLAACGGGGGTSASGQGSFQLTKISVLEGAIWEINRPIEFTFSQDVNFATVSLNTLNIAALSGAPATGAFFFKPVDLDGDGIKESVDRKSIIFQPTCPKLADLSDAGLQPGSISYRISAIGESSGASNVVRSTTGQGLQVTQQRNFKTPASSDPSIAFIDTVPGPPVPVVRLKGSSETAATYIEIGGDDSNRVYFEFDENTQTTDTNPPGFEVPLNLFSDPSTKVAVVIEFNQPVSPSSSNLSDDVVRIEYLDANQIWTPIDTRVQLVANCTATGGASVRLEPIGILPPASRFRAAVLRGFQDIVGQANALDMVQFAEAPTLSTQFNSLDPPGLQADGLDESFDVGGNDPNSFEDADALFASTKALWGNGALTSAFTFQGTGGNETGDFDWYIRAGQVVIFDTTSTTISGGPGGIPSSTQIAVNGIVDVRDLVIEDGGTLRVQGPNPMVVNATGRVEIRGTWDVSGFNAKDVATLNTGNQPEKGGAGSASGGDGGNASEITNNSTKRGGTGFGPFQLPKGGGQGGESGYAPSTLGKNARRPGAGGGGALGDYPGATDPLVEAMPGQDGDASSTGCESGIMPAAGGVAGPVPFVDSDPNNNVFGVRPITDGAGNLIDIVQGELTKMSAGSGGGGGGDALPSATCPTPMWQPGSDEKGGGGGGGAGGLRVNALGPIVFGANGTLMADGGMGATGENTINLDHVGGSGGGGSGGHIILESAAQIDFTDGDPNAAVSRDYVQALGGLGAIGNPAIHVGGPGGGGIIQLHVPDPIAVPSTDANASIRVPLSAATSGDPLGAISTPTAIPMIQTFGARSEARSKWVSIGGADQVIGGGEELVAFTFDGVDKTVGTDQGKILETGGVVDELPALIAEPLTGNPNVGIAADAVTLTIAGSSLDPLINDTGVPSTDIYLRTPALLRNFDLKVIPQADPSSLRHFDVVAGSYDDANVILSVTVSSSLGTLQDFVDAQGGGAVDFELIPRFFRVCTDGVEDSLPDTAFVRVTFDATTADANGNPDESNLLIDGTGDISDFNALMPGEIQFFRFNVEFQLDANGTGLSTDTKPIALEFLKVPFRF